VRGGVGEHRLEAASRVPLSLGALGGGGARGVQALDEVVAHALELGEAEQARRAGPVVVAHDRVGRQLALEARDLRAQGGAGRGGGVVVGPSRGRTREQAGHRQPPMGARGFAPQKTWVPSMPIRCTSTRFKTMDFAVALPTPTGPPLAV
jgi:hypothetical protein